MEKVCEFLKSAGTYYLATVEGDQPRVRPFGTAHIFEGKLYIQTGRSKPVSSQIALEHICLTCSMLCETNSTVAPEAMISCIRS